MSGWQHWVDRPQGLWLRKALFQIHLWSGIGIGLYVLVSSITGSAIVFRNEIYNTFTKGPTLVTPVGERMKAAQIEEAARAAYPRNAITFQARPKNPNQAVEIWLERNGTKRQRLFDPYSGKDLGDAISPVILWTAWLGDLHINLLSKDTGRKVNGIGAILLTILCLTGAIIWWPGVRSWKRNLGINPRASWKRINWDLHSAVGFWTFGLVFMWAFTGIYVVFPEPFQRAINRFAPLDYYKLIDEVKPPQVFQLAIQSAPGQIKRVADDPPPPPRRPRFIRRRSTGDKILGALYAAHFGNFGGWPVKALWVVLGLAPSLLFVTGVIMWWNRKLSKTARLAARSTAGEPVLTTGS
jgi:uncharacterized iron-regulated membrane protein